MKRFMASILFIVLINSSIFSQDTSKADIDNGVWTLRCIDFFAPGKPLNIYATRENGQWVAALGTSRLPNSNRHGWNVAKYVVDMAAVQVQGNSFQGKIKVMLTADPWIPADHRPRQATLQVQGKFGAPDPAFKAALRGLEGTYQARLEAGIRDPNKDAEIVAKIIGGVTPSTIGPLHDITYNLIFHNLIPGGKDTDNQRRLWVGLSLKDGQVISVRSGFVNMRHEPYDIKFFDPPPAIKFTKNTLEGEFIVPVISLDGKAIQVKIHFKGSRVQGFLAGTYVAVMGNAGGQEDKWGSGFDGTVTSGAVESKLAMDDLPWFVPVKDHLPTQPGEHPRLFFRKADLPQLRKRAETPEGRYLIARLKTLLGGGEEMPRSLNPAAKAYAGNKFRAEEGSYSISHAAGFGFLYQLTGDRKYANLARACVELAWKGQRDFDDRYAWVMPGGELRAGPVLGWYAVAYDLCYDAWPEDSRQKFAQAIQNYNQISGEGNGKEGINLRKMAFAPHLGPNSNHFGAVAGGCGLAVLAIKGDPGIDKELFDRYDENLQRAIAKNLTGGFGDGGFFAEGHGPGGLSSDTAFVPYLQALRVAQGRDYINGPRPNARNVTMLRVWEMLGPPAVHPYRSSMGSSYGTAEFFKHRKGLSRGGQFCQGFGAVSEADKGPLLWCFNTFVEPEKDTTFDTVNPYPHRAMLAFINWPFGTKPVNPAAGLPKVQRDSIHEYWVMRNRWQDSDDIVVTALLKGIKGTKPAGVLVWGLGTRNEMPAPALVGPVTEYATARDRSVVLSTGKAALAVDFSKASGADGLIVLANAGQDKTPGNQAKARFSTWTAGKTEFLVLTLSRLAQHPEIRVVSDVVHIGGQTVHFDGKSLRLGKFTAEK